MKSHISWITVLLTLIFVTGCATGQRPTRYINIGDMLPCEIISLKDGSKMMCQVQFTSSIQRGGTMTAFNPVSDESFEGQYRTTLTGGGSSTGVVRDSLGWTTGTVKTTSNPTSAVARGFFKGDKGTVIDVSMDLRPVKNNADDYSYLFFDGQGTGSDNQGNRYQIYFGY